MADLTPMELYDAVKAAAQEGGLSVLEENEGGVCTTFVCLRYNLSASRDPLWDMGYNFTHKRERTLEPFIRVGGYTSLHLNTREKAEIRPHGSRGPSTVTQLAWAALLFSRGTTGRGIWLRTTPYPQPEVTP